MTTQAAAAPETKACPYCAETIRREAQRCRYCGADLKRVPRAVRALAASPLLAAASIVIGLASGAAEVVQFAFNVKNDALGFGESETTGDEGSVVVIVAAVVVAVIGFVGARLIRRRPLAASGLLALGGIAGLAAVAIGRTNWLLVALSCLLLVAAAVVLVARPERRLQAS